MSVAFRSAKAAFVQPSARPNDAAFAERKATLEAALVPILGSVLICHRLKGF